MLHLPSPVTVEKHALAWLSDYRMSLAVTCLVLDLSTPYLSVSLVGFAQTFHSCLCSSHILHRSSPNFTIASHRTTAILLSSNRLGDLSGKMAEADSATTPLADKLSEMSLEDIQEKYRAIRIGGGSLQGPLRPTFDTDHPVDLLYAIELDQRVADAVQEVEFMPHDDEYHLTADNRDTDWDTEFHGSSLSKSNLANLQTHPIDMIDLGLTVDVKSQWKNEINVGGRSATFAILLCKLPNVSSLGLTGNGDTYKPYLDKVFRQASTQDDSVILSKLQKAFVSHWDTEFGEDIEVVDELVLIPSLKKLECHLLGDDAPNDYQCLQTKTSDTRTSNIEEVEITHSQFSPSDIAEFLKPLVNLKKLDYEGQFDWVVDDDDPDPEEDSLDIMREEFTDAAGDMLEQRELIWKANNEELKIRKKDLASEIEDFDEGKPSAFKTTHTYETMPNGMVKHTTTFG